MKMTFFRFVFHLYFLSFLGLQLANAKNANDSNKTSASQQLVIVKGHILAKANSFPSDVKVLAFKPFDDESKEFAAEIQGADFTLTLPSGSYIVVAKSNHQKSVTHSIRAEMGGHKKLDLILFFDQGAMPSLQSELIAMSQIDQQIRFQNINNPQQTPFSEVAKIDAQHEARIKQILDNYSWPSADLIGIEGVSALWLMVQHASPELIKRCLPLMQIAANKGELSWQEVALTIDRDLLSDGKKQLYGSQVTIKNNTVNLQPVEDEEHLDDRRKAIGMPPFEEYKNAILKMYAPEGSH